MRLTNEGIIVENSFTVNIYPFVRSGSVTVPADYRVELIEAGFDSQNQYKLAYFNSKRQYRSNRRIDPISVPLGSRIPMARACMM